jgi:Ca2+-binding RTX toxin-like protein
MGANFGNTPPTRFIVGNFGGFAGSWEYNPFDPQITDSAFGAYWDPVQSDPGSETTYLMTYGVGVGGQGGGGDPIPGCDPAQTQCGTTGDDNLSATNGEVEGGPGNDTINLTVDGETNSLTVDGGGGADKIILNVEDATNLVPVRVSSGDGADQIMVPRHPGVLTPVIKTGGGNDVMKIVAISGSSARLALFQDEAGRYQVNAGGGNDRVTLGATDDVVDGATGDDKLNGAAGSDEVEGGEGNDDMDGGEGGDVLHGGDGANDFAGGPGTDTCLSDTRRDRFAGCERIRRNHRRNHLPL